MARSVAIALAMFICSGVSPAAELTVQFERGLDGFIGFHDTSLFSESENSGGGTKGLFSGTNAVQQHRRCLLRVDLAAIPANAIITDVTLTMRVERSGDNFGNIDYMLHRLLKEWGEGTVIGGDEGGYGGVANPGDATWLHSKHGIALWDTAGGDFAVEASATAPAGKTGSTATWAGAGLVSDVQGWVSHPETNFGWIAIGALEGTSLRVKKFASSESIQFRPRLAVVYKLPSRAEDIDGNDAVDAVDVQLVINAALGLAEIPSADVDQNNSVDAVDVQLVINAALGL